MFWEPGCSPRNKDSCKTLLEALRGIWGLGVRTYDRGPTHLSGCLVPKTRTQELSEKAAEERQRALEWLFPFMTDNKPKFLTKAELCEAAVRELQVSKNSFDVAWMIAIDRTGREDWYEPLRRRPSTRN